MKKLYTLLTILLVVTSLHAQNQYTYNQAEWYIGAGSDTAYFVIDFQTALTYDPPSSFLYGYLFEDSVSGTDLMQEIAQADLNLTIDFVSGFVDSVSLGTYQGKNGSGGNYWGIFSDTIGLNRWASNSGVSEMILPNEYYGLSFTDFAPVVYPDTAVAVNNSMAFTTSHIQYFVGSGSDTAVMVIDFLDGNAFAWGYLFEDSVSAESALNALNADDDSLTVSINGFLNDITYMGIEGLAGAPNYWNTWSANNNGLWYTNAGIGEMLYPGSWFGCSYPNYPPAIFPTSPEAALKDGISGIANLVSTIDLEFYPNPTSGTITISNLNLKEVRQVQLISVLGESMEIPIDRIHNNNFTIPSKLNDGLYWLFIQGKDANYTAKIYLQ